MLPTGPFVVQTEFRDGRVEDSPRAQAYVARQQDRRVPGGARRVRQHLDRHRAGELITGQVRAVTALMRVTEATARGYVGDEASTDRAADAVRGRRRTARRRPDTGATDRSAAAGPPGGAAPGPSARSRTPGPPCDPRAGSTVSVAPSITARILQVWKLGHRPAPRSSGRPASRRVH